MAVTKRTRFEVLRRDDYTCRYCRSKNNELTVDHVVPVSLGGTDKPDNLVACCRDCNFGKSSAAPDQSLVADVEGDVVRWAAARRRAAEKLAAHRNRYVAVHTEFLKSWMSWDKDGGYLPDDWKSSIDGWLDQGLTFSQIDAAHDIAIGKRSVRSQDVFRYMSGVLKNWLIELDEATRAELAKSKDV